MIYDTIRHWIFNTINWKTVYLDLIISYTSQYLLDITLSKFAFHQADFDTKLVTEG